MIDSTALDISALLERFSLYLKNKGRSKITVRFYLGDIKRTLREDNVNRPSSFNELFSSLEKGLQMAGKEKMHHNTFNRRIASLNNLNAFLREEFHIEDTPHYSNYFRKAAIRENLRVISEEEYSSLMNQIPREDLLCLRARALFSLVYGAGLTSGEIIRVNYYDFGREDMLIKSIRVKNRKGEERVLELDNSTKEELADYEKIALSEETDIKSHDHPYFKIRDGATLSLRRINSIFKRRQEIAGLDPTLNFTSLRFNYAKRLIEEGLHIKELACRLGVSYNHASSLKIFLPK